MVGPIHIIRRAEFISIPWKNGAGVTHEALRMPPRGDPFLWRVSVAEVAASGPFSDFTGYHRVMVLLRGDGVRLNCADGSAPVLRETGDLVEFDGAMETHCELLGGACTDLNFMLARTIAACDVRVEHLRSSLLIERLPENSLLLFTIRGGVTLEVGGAGPVILGEWDLVHAPPGGANQFLIDARDRDLDTQVFTVSFRGN